MKKAIKSSIFILVTILTLFSLCVSVFAALKGDIDGDGSLTSSDARFVLRASVGLETLSDNLKKIADADGDGTITASDARLVLRASVGLEVLGDAEHKHEYKYETLQEPTCTNTGKQKMSCKTCSYSTIETIKATGHTMGEWKTIVDSTAQSQGYERSKCSKCSYYKDRVIPVKPAVYYITVTVDSDNSYKTAVAADGKYSLSAPRKLGYIFKGWADSSGKAFASSGTVKANTTVRAVWELDATDSLNELVARAEAGAEEILITGNITVNTPIFVPYKTHIYSNGNYSITRASDYDGDIFVVGSDKEGNKTVLENKKAALTLGGGKGMLTIDGNRDNVTKPVNGTAVFVADSSELNIYDGVRIINNNKTGNDRTYQYEYAYSTDTVKRIGGAAVINLSSTVNMYGGILENNAVATEYTQTPKEDGSISQTEDNGCGGAVYNKGTFNMLGGTIKSNEALRGGGVYNDRFCYLIAGEISDNLAHTYGGAVSSSSSSNANMFTGSENGTEKMVFKNNRSIRAGGALYSNTSSPIILYPNTEIINNRSDSSGGAVYTAGPLVAEGVTFIGNTCEYSGGAIYHHYTKAEFKRRYMILTSCTFEGNKGGLGGAVILSSSGTATNEGTYAEITDCTFTNNQAIVTSTNPGNGGAVYITRNSDAIIKSCTFSENNAVKNAGALAIHSSATVDISDCSFNKNTANLGGAVYTSSESVVDMLNIEFNENSAIITQEGAGGNGGALYYASAKLTLKNVDFKNNFASNNAGAVYQNASTLTLDQTCSFYGNKAGNHGGAFYLTYTTEADGTKTGSVLKAENVTFEENSALAGGAVSGRTNSDITFKNVKFLRNTTPDAAVSTTTGGGAIYSNNSKLNITDSHFDGNESGYYGGALRLDACDSVINNTEIANSTGGTGGAVYASGESLKTKNLTLTGNKSALNGVMYIACREATFDKLTATGNSGVNGGVLYAGKGSKIKLTDSALSGNTAKYGGTLYVTANSDVEADNCKFIGNSIENGHGGAVYVYGAFFKAHNNSVFEKNTSTGNGGAVGAFDIQDETTLEKTPSTVDISDCTFTENTGFCGGAVYFNDSEYSIENCDFLKNNATSETYGGGAVYNTGATGTIEKATFTENTALRGGAVAIYTNSSVELSNITATANEAAADGGAIYANKCSVDLTNENIVLRNNKANNGGAVYATSAPLFNVSGAVIENNEAANNGGALYASGSTVNISGKDTVISGNKAAAHGGAVYLSYVTDADSQKIGGTLNITDTEIKGNSALYGGAISGRTNSTINLTRTVLSENSTSDATMDNKAGGGAIYSNNSAINISASEITDNSSGYYGGAVFTEVCNVSIKDNTLIDGNHGGTGAALYLAASSSLDAKDITVTNNRSSMNGILYLNGKEFVIDNMSASGNSAMQNGGVIYTSGSGSLSVTDSVFDKNTVTNGAGGSIYHTAGNATIANVSFTENSAKNGGVIYTSGNGTLSINDSVFDKNTATNGSGGSICHTAGNATIANVSFTENSAKNGGAVYLNDADAQLTDVTFSKNTATTNGGAVDIVGSRVTLTGTSGFSNNSAGSHGGAVYVTYINASADGQTPAIPGSLTATNGTFTGNSALGGGAVSIRSNCEAIFNGSVFTENTVTGYEIKADGTGAPDGNGEGGGAVYVGYGKLTLTNVTAENNEALSSLEVGTDTIIKSFGGVISSAGADITVTGGTFSGNKASIGGAIHAMSSTDVTISNSAFNSNESSYTKLDYDNTVGGGAVNIIGGSLDMDTVTFDGNKTGYYGGALMASGTVVDISDSIFTNSEGATGAALHFKSKADVTISDTQITDNTSSANGVVYANNSSVTTTSLTATKNTAAKGGVFYVSNANSVISVIESTITNNSATSNGGVVYTENATVSFTDCNISDNIAKNGGAAYSDRGIVNFTGGEIAGNSATNGGVIYLLNGNVSFTGGEITDNSATTGGAIYTTDSILTVEGTEFTENTASSNGGAAYIRHSELSMEDAEFSSNSAKNHGGAADIAGSTAVLTGNNSFTANTAGNHGGAVYVVYLDVEEEGTEGKTTRIPSIFTMEDGTFTGNTALGGGAVSIRSDCEATFSGTSFIENTVSGFSGEADGDGEGGGAIYVGYGKLTLNNVTANGNIAEESTTEGTDEINKSFGGAVDGVGADITVTGGSYSGNKASAGGAFNLMTKSSLHIKDALIENNESVYVNSDYTSDIGGGAIKASDGTISIDNTTLSGNKSNYYGGTVLTSGTEVNIVNGSIIKNSTGGTGAALYFKANSKVTINNSKVADNTATNNGVVYANNSTITATGFEASGNKAKNGGVIYVSNASTVVTINDSIITGNSATANGGVVYTENATISFTDCNISDNSAKNGGTVYSDRGKVNFTGGKVAGNGATTGGAIYTTDSILTVKGTEFTANTASSNGGAAYIRHSELSMEDAEFSSNSAKNHGGAADIAGSTAVLTGNNSFTENTAGNHGGAVYVVYLDVEEEGTEGKTTRIPSIFTMEDGAFTGNTALGGGAVSIRSDCEATFNGTSFSGNTVSGFSGEADGDGEGGGAIYVGYGKLHLTNSVFNGNVANETVNTEDNSVTNSFGGAIDSVSSTITITDGSFDENKATSGGAIHLFNKSVLTVSGTSLTNNESTGNTSSPVDSSIGGGAILSNKSTVTLSGAVLSGNKTNYYGGAVHGIASTITIDQNSEVSNTSGATGAALYFKDSSNVTLKDITVSGNTSSSNGVIYTNSGTLTAENVTANKNNATNGGVLYVSGGSAKAYIIGGVWSENTANMGGALVVNTSVVEADGVTFSDNSSTLGGAVYIAKGEFTADNTEFINNRSAKNFEGKNGNGGAVSIGAGTFKSSENIKFSNNTAEAHGGAVYVSYATNTDGTKIPGILNITGCIFENNSAAIGGAISARTSCITTLNGTVLKDNTATDANSDGGGGAIYANDNTVTLSGVTATGNSTGYYGGVLTGVNANVTVNNNSSFSSNLGKTGPVFNFRGTSKVTINSISVTDNKVSNGNGIIYMTGSGTLDVTELSASGNANTNGGMFYISGSAPLSIKNSVLSGNTATGFGGAIDFRSSGTLTVTNTEISGNTAKNGGAMNLAGSGAVTISSCDILGNTATASGGALYVTGSGKVTVSEDTEIKENTAPTAGAVHLDKGADATFSSSLFENNSATGGDGGAILVSDSSEEGTAATKLTLNSVTFNENTASSKGGAISTDTSSPNIEINASSCIFTKNKALGAGGGAIEIQNGNCTSATAPEKLLLTFINCKYIENTSKTTGAAAEIRTSSCAKFDGVEATENAAGSKQNGGVFYVTSNHSRLYLTGTVIQSSNSASNGKFAYLYNNNYSNPPRIYTTHSNTASWVADVGGNKTAITYDMAIMP